MPFADYKDFADCVSKNQDKGDPDAYCATIMRKTEAVDGRPGTPEKFKDVEQAVAKSGSAKDPAAVTASVLRKSEAEYATIKHGSQKVVSGSKQDRYLHVKDLTHSHVKTDGKKQITRHGTKKSLDETKFELKEASEQKYEIKDPRGDGAVLDDRGQPNIIDYSNQEPLLFGLGDNSSHEYPGKIVITNESRYVDREVKRSNIPNVAATGKDATGADKTQPTLPTGAPYELMKPSHNMHGLNFNSSIDWNKQEVVSIGSGLVARQIGTGKKKEGGPGSGRLSKIAGKISAHAPIVAAQLVNLATQIPLEGVDEEDRKEMVEAIMKDELRILIEAVFVEEEHPRGQPDNPGQFVSKGGGTSKTVISKLKLNTDRIDTIKQSHLESKATFPMVDAGGYFEDNLPHLNSFEVFQTEEEYFDMKEAIENGKYEKSDALFLKALKKQPKAEASFKEISEDLAGFNAAMKEKTKNATEIYRFTDTGELDNYLEKDSTFGASHYAVGKDANYKCFTLEPFNKFFREAADVIITTPTESFKDNMEAAEYSSFPRSEAYGNKEAIDNQKSGRYALETEVRVRSNTKVPVGKMKIEFLNHMSFNTVDKLKEKYSSLGELTFPNARSEFIDK